MALTLTQKKQAYTIAYAGVSALGSAEYLRSFIAQGGPTASDPVALAALIIADVLAYRATNDTRITLGSTIFDNAIDAETLARLG